MTPNRNKSHPRGERNKSGCGQSRKYSAARSRCKLASGCSARIGRTIDEQAEKGNPRKSTELRNETVSVAWTGMRSIP